MRERQKELMDAAKGGVKEEMMQKSDSCGSWGRRD